MSVSSSNWFKYLKEVRHGADNSPRPEAITEGLRDIGLSAYVIHGIERSLTNVPEKAKTFLGNVWKNSTIERDHPRHESELQDRQFILAEALADEYSSYLAAPDLDPEKKKKITLILTNLKDAIAKPYGSWPKAFKKGAKALSKVGVPPEIVEHTKESLQEFLEAAWNRWARDFSEIIEFLNDDPTNYKLAEDAREDDTGQIDLRELLLMARDYIENKEDPERILHTFDDGSYWYDTGTSSCPIEADRMGHCGSDSRGVLVSLRKKKEKRRESSSYVTMTWSRHEDILYQIKGRANDAPPRATWSHIEWFIDNMDITRVEETGEHSNDYDGFVEMNEYLALRTNAKFANDIEEKIAEVEQEVERININFADQRNELDVTDVGCSVESGEDYGGDPNSIFLSMTCDSQFEMDLGWPFYYQKDGFYVASDGPDSERPLDFAEIPTNSWGSEASEFVDQIEIDDIAHDLPGEDPETDWEIRMMEGTDGKTTAHLIVTLTNRETEGSAENADDYDYYVDRVLDFDHDYQSYREKIRRGLVAGGFMAKSPFDHAEQEMIEMDLLHFDVGGAPDDGIQFAFISESGESLIASDIKVPSFVYQYLIYLGTDTPSTRVGPARRFSDLYTQTFTKSHQGVLRDLRDGTLSGPALNRYMTAHMQSAFRSKNQAASKDQLTFDYGKDYETPEAKLVLAKDSRFSITPKIKYIRDGKPPEIEFVWSYSIQVSTKDSEEELQIVRNIVEYLDKNPEIVTGAAEEIIEQSLEPIVEEAEQARQRVLSPSYFVETIADIEKGYGGMPVLGDRAAADLRNILNWFVKSYDKMNEVEKFTMYKYWLKPMANRTYRQYSAANQWDGDADTGQPRNFKDFAGTEMTALGAPPSSTRQYMQRQEEGIEEQIARVDRLLNEVDSSYDLRIYSMTIGANVSNELGGTEAETAAEIRGINGVTTVRPVPAGKKRLTPHSEYIPFEIKFELVGPLSRVKYRDAVLFPGLRRIKGLEIVDWTPMHRINRKGSIRQVREAQKKQLVKVLMEDAYGGSMGGLGGNMAAATMQTPSPTRPTPTPTIDDLVADWAEGGVQLYDAPTDTTNMAYHVMMPVSELWPYASTYYRGDKPMFDGQYQAFIKDGATAPVYLAIGKNARVKITGNEDIVWYAKKAGLQEVPVFISYQRQV